jgi:hypothetical protein
MFVITSIFGILSYVWILIVLHVSSMDIVEIWEAFTTIGFFFIVLVITYVFDKWHEKKLNRDLEKMKSKTLSESDKKILVKEDPE